MSGIINGILWEWAAITIATLGFYVSFRILRFPDLTVEASYAAGGVGMFLGAFYFKSWIVAVAISMCLGAAAGLATGLVYALNPRGMFRLLASVLVVFGAYSVNFRLLGSETSQGLQNTNHLWNNILAYERQVGLVPHRLIAITLALLIAGALILFVFWLLRTALGTYLRVAGYRREILFVSGHSPVKYTVLGLVIANSLVAIGGNLHSAIYANISLDGGSSTVILDVLAALLLGEILIDSLKVFGDRRSNILAGLAAVGLGTLAYLSTKGVIIHLMSERKGPFGVEYYVYSAADQSIVVAMLIVLIVATQKLLSVHRSNQEEDEDGL